MRQDVRTPRQDVGEVAVMAVQELEEASGGAFRAASAAYLVQTGRREPLQFTPDSSRRARGVEVWAALRSLGRAGVADI